MPTQSEKATAFRVLHQQPGTFLIPNPYDPGSARLLEHLGFPALATTSGGFAFTQGRPDYGIRREDMLSHVAALTAATGLPVSGDLENGFGDAPETAAETIRLAAAAGLVGGSIEDATNRDDDPIYDMAFATERIRAAAEAAHSLAFPFLLTARSENYLHGRVDLSDTIARLQAFQEAGADVLFAPGLSSLEDIATVVRSIDRPLNVLATPQMTRAALADIGVKRISVGSALARAALGAFVRGAKEMLDDGTFQFAKEPLSYGELNKIFG